MYTRSINKKNMTGNEMTGNEIVQASIDRETYDRQSYDRESKCGCQPSGRHKKVICIYYNALSK